MVIEIDHPVLWQAQRVRNFWRSQNDQFKEDESRRRFVKESGHLSKIHHSLSTPLLVWAWADELSAGGSNE